MLSDLTIVELAGGPAAEIAAGVLTDLGARTLVLEPESWPLRDAPGFHVWSRGKQSLVVEPGSPRVGELAARADVLVADEDVWVAAGEPRGGRVTLVLETLADGEWPPLHAPRAAAPAITEAFSGMAYMQQGYRDGPYFLVEEVASFGAALLGCLGALAVLYANRPDESELVRVSHLDGSLGVQLFSATFARDAPQRDIPIDGDPLRITTPAIRFHKAADGKWMMLGAVSPSLWAKMVLALELPELLGDPRYTGAPFNIPEASDRVELAERIAAAIALRPRAEWLEIFREAGVIAGALYEPDQALDTTEVALAGLRMEIGELVMPGPAIQRLGEPPRQVGVPAPAPGEHDAAWLAALEARAPLPAQAPERAAPPLDGLKIVEVTTMAAAPGAVRLLAGLGAEVTKIEPPEGDPMRSLAYTFAGLNRGKRSVVVKLGDESGRAEVEDLVRGADLVLHNLREGGARRARLTTAELRALNPHVNETRVGGYGVTPDVRESPSIDFVFESICGAPLMQGGGESPVGWGGGVADNGTSLVGSVASLAGLYARKQGAGPQSVGVSLLATLLYRHANVLVAPLADWRAAMLGVDPVGPTATHRYYRTADDWLLLAATSEPEQRALPEAPEGLEALFATRTTDEWLEELSARAVPATRPLQLGEFVRAAADAGSRLAEDFTDPKWGGLIGLGELIRFQAPGWRRLGSPPELATLSTARS